MDTESPIIGRLLNQRDTLNPESLNLSLSVMKSLASEYAINAQHAQATVATLMQEKLPVELQQDLMLKVMEQLDQRANDRSIHQNAIIQATVIALGTAVQILTSKELVNNKQERAASILQHAMMELDRCLNADAVALELISEAYSDNVASSK